MSLYKKERDESGNLIKIDLSIESLIFAIYTFAALYAIAAAYKENQPFGFEADASIGIGVAVLIVLFLLLSCFFRSALLPISALLLMLLVLITASMGKEISGDGLVYFDQLFWIDPALPLQYIIGREEMVDTYTSGSLKQHYLIHAAIPPVVIGFALAVRLLKIKKNK